MKKFYPILFAILIGILPSCNKQNSSNEQEQEEKIYSVVGVWSDGTYSVSFDKNGYFCGYLDKKIINNGTYKQVGNKKIECEYFWRSMIPFGRDTYFDIQKINEKSINMKAVSTDATGNKFEREYKMQKTDIEPTPEKISAIGKVWEYVSSNGTVKYTLVTADIGMKTNSKYPMSLHPIDFYYICIGDKIYCQTFFLADNATIGGWTNNVGNGEVYAISLSDFR